MKQLLLVMVAACGTSEPGVAGYAGLAPGEANAGFDYQFAESNASHEPFVAATSVVTGDPAGELEVVFSDADGLRTLTFTLTGPFAEGGFYDEFAVYREGENLQWASRPAGQLGGALTVEAASSSGFTFRMSTIMVATSADATEEIIFDGNGDVAFP